MYVLYTFPLTVVSFATLKVHKGNLTMLPVIFSVEVVYDCLIKQCNNVGLHDSVYLNAVCAQKHE